MRRRDFIVAIGGAALGTAASPIACPHAARAAERVRRVGVLTTASESEPLTQPIFVRFREELAKLGWIEGRNLRIDDRFAAGDTGRLAAYAEELVKLRPDAIFAFTVPAVRAVQQRTQVIPIVFAGGGDAFEAKLVNSVARPTGNVTGFANRFTSLGGKWLQHVPTGVNRDSQRAPKERV